MLDALIPQEDADAAKELAKQFSEARHRAPARQAVHEGRGRRRAADRPLRRRRDRRGRPDARLGRPRAAVEGLGLEAAGVEFDKRAGIATDEHRRTSVPHIYAVGDCAGYWQLAHTAFREGEVAAENACGHEAIVDAAPFRGRSTPTRRSPPSASPRRRRASSTATTSRSASSRGRERARRDAGRDRRLGQVDPRDEVRRAARPVMVGPHVTDLIEAGVIAIDAESTVETVADGIAPHPTLSEAIKEAGLVALGRAIHVPNRKPRAKTPA